MPGDDPAVAQRRAPAPARPWPPRSRSRGPNDRARSSNRARSRPLVACQPDAADQIGPCCARQRHQEVRQVRAPVGARRTRARASSLVGPRRRARDCGRSPRRRSRAYSSAQSSAQPGRRNSLSLRMNIVASPSLRARAAKTLGADVTVVACEGDTKKGDGRGPSPSSAGPQRPAGPSRGWPLYRTIRLFGGFVPSCRPTRICGRACRRGSARGLRRARTGCDPCPCRHWRPDRLGCRAGG